MTHLSQSDDSLLWAHYTSLKHQKVLVHHSIVGEPTLRKAGHTDENAAPSFTMVLVSHHWCNLLFSDVNNSGSVLGIRAFRNAVDLLVYLCAVVVAHLSGSRYTVLYPAGMPSSDASNLPQALVCLAWQFLSTPASSNTCTTVKHTTKGLCRPFQ